MSQAGRVNSSRMWGQATLAFVLGLAASTSIAVYGVGCGHQSPSPTAAKRAAQAPTSGSHADRPKARHRVNDAQDGDDSPSFPAYALESNDDREVVAFGHAASRSDARAAEATVKRFFALAVSSRGSALCAMMDPELVTQIPQMGRTADPAFSGKTCSEVMSKLLQHNHMRLVRETNGVKVTAVRVGPEKVLALLAFKSTAERRYLLMRPEHGELKLAELLDGPFP